MLGPVMDHRRHRGHHHQRGLSLVELLVGSAVGLIVAAAATSVVSANLRENRQLQTEARLMQDLRSAADLIARDLRRAGYWAAAPSGVRGADGTAPAVNPYSADAVDAAASDAIGLSFSRDAVENGSVDDSERFGFRLRAGAVEIQLGLGNWQALTDAGTLVVTAFRVEPRSDEVSLAAFCERSCAASGASCPPRQLVRSFAVTLAARSARDAAVTRSLQSSVRLRNDAVLGSCAG